MIQPGTSRIELHGFIPEDWTFKDDRTGRICNAYPFWKWDGLVFDPEEWWSGETARAIAKDLGIDMFLGECVSVECHQLLKGGGGVNVWEEKHQ